MVDRVFKIMFREVRGLHQAAYVLAILTFGSQILALIRDRLLAHEFGAGIELDLYYTAFRIPDVLYVLFASTLSVYVLIPFVAERINGTDATRARNLLSQIFTLFLVTYSVLALVSVIFAPHIVTYIFPGFSGNEETLVLLMRILLFQPFFLGISSLLGVITQFANRFILYAVSPLLYNLGIIGGVLLLYPHYGVAGLAWGVVFGAIAHLCVQIPFIRTSELAPYVTLKLHFSEIRDVLMTSIPRALTLSLHQLMLLGLISFASVMTVGSVSVLQFAYNLQSVPLTIIGVSYSVAAFPLLAQLYAEKAYDRFSAHIMTALRHILFWSIPVIALLVVMRAQFVRVVLGTGAFDWNDTRLTAAILALFAFSLAAQALHLLIVRALYAIGNTRLPFLLTLLSSLLALIFSFGTFELIQTIPKIKMTLLALMRLNDVGGVEVLALPLGYSLALYVHTVLLFVCARKQLFINLRIVVEHALRSLIAAFGGGIVAYLALKLVSSGIETDTLLAIFGQGIVGGIAGIAAVVLIHYFLKSTELTEIYRSVHKRLLKTEVVIAQDEDQLGV